MKRRLYLILLLAAVTLSGIAQNIGEVFYIYRNDGQFNAFFRDEVLSIEYSYEDADGNHYDEIVTQIVNTAYSVYKIPLAVIDSVGFVTPETQYKPGVINLQDGLRTYVVSFANETITLKSDTPNNLLPHIGDKIVTIEMSDLFPIGYAGEVKEIRTSSDGILLICESAALEDVFECFYGFTHASPQAQNSKRAWWDDFWDWVVDILPDGVYRGSIPYQPEPFQQNLTYGLPNNWEVTIGDWAGRYQSNFNTVFAPRMWINGFVKIRSDERFFSITITGDYSLREEFSYTGKLSWNPTGRLNISTPLPVCQFLQVFVEPGFFVKAEIETSSSMTLTQRYSSAFHYEWSSNNTTAMEPIFDIRPRENTFNISGASGGEMAFGLYVDLGIQAFNRNIASINGHAELGLYVSGNADMNLNNENYNSTTQLYDMLKNSYFEGGWYWGANFEAQLTPFLKIPYGHPVGRHNAMWRTSLVPTFSNVSFEQCSNPQTSADAYMEISGNCVSPVEIGLSVRDENNIEVDDHYAQTHFLSGNYSFSHTFANLSSDREYTLYPKVRMNGFEMLASPSAEINMKDDFPVTLSDFKVTNSQHEKGAFIHEGVAYDYRFYVSVTATLDDDAEGIADWGYVYLDPDGNEASISLKKFGNSYTDTRWAYFRNGTPPFTCTLYGYVKYADSNETIYDEPYDYLLVNLCPDDNHPHMIDLGLPSGTKWACCNVGATTPQGYGDYFAWGAVKPNYGSSGIAPDIAGTEYDAATANWGNPWRMPTKNQCEELIDYCYSVEANYNGVKGRIFTGQNEFSIFLPATGYYKPSGYRDTGNGHYHSSTYGGNNDNTWALCFDYKSVYLERDDWRHCRLPVRPCTIENE